MILFPVMTVAHICKGSHYKQLSELKFLFSTEPHCELFNHVLSSDQSSAPSQSAVNQEAPLGQGASAKHRAAQPRVGTWTCGSPVRCEGTTQVHMEVLQVFESYGCLYVHKEYPQGDGGQADAPL